MKKNDNYLGIEEQYALIAESILEKGLDKHDRTGTGTKSIFSAQIVHDMQYGFPLLTTKRMHWNSIVVELMWFLKGRTDLRYLLENGCRIWTGDAYKSYERVHHWDLENPEYNLEEFEQQILKDDDFSKQWGNLGFIYGKQWRDWNGDPRSGINIKGIDQISEIVDTLRKDPDSRRMIVNAWNVSDLMYMKLPPCHWAFELYTEETDLGKRRLSLKWHQRSVDLPLGLPFNVASYGLLLNIIAKEVNMIPGMLVGDLTNVHIYNNQIEGIKTQLKREPRNLPELVLKDPFWELCETDLSMSEKIEKYSHEWFTVEDYMPHPSIKIPLSN